MGKGFNPGQARDSHGRWTSSAGFAKMAKSSLNGKDPRKMDHGDRIKAAEIMFGTGSKQHKQAIKKWKGNR